MDDMVGGKQRTHVEMDYMVDGNLKTTEKLYYRIGRKPNMKVIKVDMVGDEHKNTAKIGGMILFKVENLYENR